MSLHRLPLVLGFISLVLGFAPGCKERITYIECPLGTLPVGDHCEAMPPTEELPTVPKPDVVTVPDGGFGEDVGQVDESETQLTPQKDTTVEQQAEIGVPCAKDDDCGGGVCLDWPGGYCTLLDCEDGGCPAGSRCALLKGGNTGCLKTCDDGDCPEEGHGCKLLTGIDGALSPYCYGIYDESGGVGAPCDDHAACQGNATCLSSFPGGYCGVLGCGPETCPVGSDCFVFADVPTCLQGCHADEDCTSGPEAERRCSVLQDVTGKQTGACISAAGGQQIGEQCLNAFECESGTCETLGDGACSQSGKPCFVLTEVTDCQADEFCLVTGDNQVGACTQPCSLLVPCPGASLCQGIPGVPEGWCRPPCEGLGANDNCRADAGFTCSYGFALGDSTGQGRYLCMLDFEGKMGDPCGLESSCAMGDCELTNETTGYCYVPCGDDLYCPFPGLCVSDGSFGSCVAACFSDADCASGSVCTAGQGTLGSVCIPEAAD